MSEPNTYTSPSSAGLSERPIALEGKLCLTYLKLLVDGLYRGMDSAFHCGSVASEVVSRRHRALQLFPRLKVQRIWHPLALQRAKMLMASSEQTRDASKDSACICFAKLSASDLKYRSSRALQTPLQGLQPTPFLSTTQSDAHRHMIRHEKYT